MSYSSEEIITNRRAWINALRSGEFLKGPVPEMDSKGKPIQDCEGYCACAVLVHVMNDSFPESKRKVGITSKQCAYIQAELSDKLDTFQEVADRIESDIFPIHG